VLRISRAGPEDLLGTVAIVPKAVLGKVELERNRQRIKLYLEKVVKASKHLLSFKENNNFE